MIEIMNTTQTANYLGICRLTLLRRRRSGKFPNPIRAENGSEIGWTIEYINEFYSKLQEKAIKNLMVT